MNITIGTQVFEYCNKINERRVNHAEIRAQQSPKEARQFLKEARRHANEEFTNTEGSFYGIAD